MLSTILPTKGTLLISEPFMADPNFKRTVVLVTENNGEGTVGYVLNQKSDLLLKDVISECWDANMHIFIGGPVANDTLHFVHTVPEKISGGANLGNGLFWGGDFEELKSQINAYNIKEEEVKFFIGYSGWSKDQLTNELEMNAWIVSNSFDTAMVLDVSDIDIWKEAVLNMGVKYAHITNFPQDPTLN
ncbi:YqgE/AlgH family protein [Pedobacter arcticus]|uniref:YqgE/AlgH family protein n=1 Tax=Pedobacter arcticus TaxID=752140 RepID=UPI00036A88B1|nr:YqgE/AlgH family protein [Pedobacter arcticus]